MLYFLKAAAAAFAGFVALAGGANGDTGGVWGALVPGKPGLITGLWKRKLVRQHFMMKDHQGVNLGLCTGFWAQRKPVGRRLFVAPEVDGRFNVGDVNACHGLLVDANSRLVTIILIA